jgi:hypothetical protein
VEESEWDKNTRESMGYFLSPVRYILCLSSTVSSPAIYVMLSPWSRSDTFFVRSFNFFLLKILFFISVI